MVTAISGANASGANAIALQSAQPSAPVARTTQTTSSGAGSAAAQADTVHLSASAQAHAMQQQGMGVKTIAANMGITTTDVDNYLGISSLTAGAGAGNALTQDAAIAAAVQVHGPSKSS